MTLEECRAALQAAETTPTQALHAAVGLAADLVPEVTALLARAAADEPLLLAEERLARYGLAALAAARRTEVFPTLGTLVDRSQITWARVFGAPVTITIPSLLTALFDGDPAALYARLRNPATPPDLQDALFLALGWLARAGRIDRETLVDALEDFARGESLPDDPAWLGWLAAAQGLGLDDQMAAVRQRLADTPPDMPAPDQEDWLRDLEKACEAEALDAAAPLTDPASVFPLPDEASLPDYPYDLSTSELWWLDWQLLTLGLAGEALPLEAVDGYFTAVHVTPGTADFSACEAEIWCGASATERFRRPEVAAETRALLARHFAWLGNRLAAGDPPDPFFEIEDEATEGTLWMRGFGIGLEHGEAIWGRLLRRTAVRELVEPLMLLEADPTEAGSDLAGDDADEVTEDGGSAPEFREMLLDQLPEAIQRLRQLVRDLPVRPEAKAGRNDSCPCGSGRKYKKCCGAPGAVPAF